MSAAGQTLRADREQISHFVDALFRYADPDSHVSLRAFRDTADGPAFAIVPARVGDTPDSLVNAATALATRCGRAPEPIVFCPPVATFRDAAAGAGETNLANGLTIAVECDSHPTDARARLEALLGPATVVVASGGEWLDPASGELQAKLHLHWRLTEPTRCDADHVTLKQARALATTLVGGDATNKPIVHPIRWPGSWHRKSEPRLAKIVSLAGDREIDLADALELLQGASAANKGASKGSASASPPPQPTADEPSGEDRRTDQLIEAILTGADYHAPLAALAMRFQKGGMPDAQVTLVLRGLMNAVPRHLRDVKDGEATTGRWQARYDDIPRAVSTARAKIARQQTQQQQKTFDISRYRLDTMTTGSAPVRRFLLEPFMPLGTVGLLVAAGGLGKSLTALDLCLAVARRASMPADARLLGPLSGNIPDEAGGASVFLTLEDDTAEIHRRADALDPKRGRDGAPCYVIPGVDLPELDPSLVVANGRAAVLTDFARDGLDRLLDDVAAASGYPVRLLVLDPAGDFLNADENDAAFVKPLMRRLREVAARHSCTILLLGHVAKSLDTDSPSMRGSSAWVANSRFAISMWRPAPEEARSLASRASAKADALVWGSLAKANHAGAPIGQKRLLARDPHSGRLQDITARLSTTGGTDDDALLDLLVEACRDYAVAGLPFSHTGVAGLYTGRADLPPALADLSKHRLQDLGAAALQSGRLVKARTTLTQGALKYLDVPDGPLSLGVEVAPFQGSRREALARQQTGKAP